jgi:hypothetical protein
MTVKKDRNSGKTSSHPTATLLGSCRVADVQAVKHIDADVVSTSSLMMIRSWKSVVLYLLVILSIAKGR